MPRERSKLRVLILEAGSGRGGSTTSLLHTLKHLNRDGIDPILAFYFRNQGPDTDLIRTLGVPVRFAFNRAEPRAYVPFRFLLGRSKHRWVQIPKVLARLAVRWTLVEIPQFFRLMGIIIRNHVDLVFVNNDIHYHVVGALAAKMTRRPIVCNKAGGVGEGRRIKRILTPWVDVFMAPSTAMEQDQRIHNPTTKRLVTIPGGIDLDFFRPMSPSKDLLEELEIDSDQKVIGSVSRFHPGKGQLELIEATALIVREHPQTVCLLAGDDASPGAPFYERLRARVAELDLMAHVRFAGWRKDVLRILSVLDVFVHCPTTWVEGLPVSLLEAIAMGKPSVVSRNGGMPDAVVDGVTGFLVDPGDVPAMAARTLILLRDASLAHAFGRRARELAEGNFSARVNTRRFEELLGEVVQSHHGTNRRNPVRPTSPPFR